MVIFCGRPPATVLCFDRFASPVLLNRAPTFVNPTLMCVTPSTMMRLDDKSFAVASPSIWNKLPAPLQSAVAICILNHYQKHACLTEPAAHNDLCLQASFTNALTCSFTHTLIETRLWNGNKIKDKKAKTAATAVSGLMWLGGEKQKEVMLMI